MLKNSRTPAASEECAGVNTAEADVADGELLTRSAQTIPAVMRIAANIPIQTNGLFPLRSLVILGLDADTVLRRDHPISWS